MRIAAMALAASSGKLTTMLQSVVELWISSGAKYFVYSTSTCTKSLYRTCANVGSIAVEWNGLSIIWMWRFFCDL